MKGLGEHILIEYNNCNNETLNNSALLEELLLKAAEIANATVVKSVFHNFSPFGVTGVVVVEESHFSIHTWPEHSYAAVDMFTCSDKMNYKEAEVYLKEVLESQNSSSKLVVRGEGVTEKMP